GAHKRLCADRGKKIEQAGENEHGDIIGPAPKRKQPRADSKPSQPAIRNKDDVICEPRSQASAAHDTPQRVRAAYISACGGPAKGFNPASGPRAISSAPTLNEGM